MLQFGEGASPATWFGRSQCHHTPCNIRWWALSQMCPPEVEPGWYTDSGGINFTRWADSIVHPCTLKSKVLGISYCTVKYSVISPACSSQIRKTITDSCRLSINVYELFTSGCWRGRCRLVRMLKSWHNTQKSLWTEKMQFTVMHLLSHVIFAVRTRFEDLVP